MKITPTGVQMRDPLVLSWVLQRLEQAREIHDLARAAELEVLFNAQTLEEHLRGPDSGHVSHLFQLLDPERFRALQAFLLEQWPSWKGKAADESAPAIAALAPDQFLPVLQQFLGQEEAQRDQFKLRGALKACTVIGSPADDLIRQLLKEAPLSELDPLPFYELLKASARLVGEEASILLPLAIKRYEAESWFMYPLGVLYQTLTGDLPYFEHLLGVLDNETDQLLSELPEFFEDLATIREVDRLVRVNPVECLPKAIELLPADAGEHAITRLAGQLARSLPFQVGPQIYSKLSCFLLATLAARETRKTLQLGDLSNTRLVELASVDLPSLPCFAELLREFSTRPRRELVPLLGEALLRSQGHLGGIHLCRAMGHLGGEEFVEPLILAMGKDCADCVAEAAERALAKIGASAEAALIGHWGFLDYSQKIYGSGVLEHIGGAPTVDFLLARFPEFKKSWSDLEAWSHMAEAVPDSRLVDLLETQLKREHSEVDLTYVTLCSLLELDRPALSATRVRVERQELEHEQVLERMAQGEGERPHPDHLVLDLLCHECGDENHYRVRAVYLDPEKPGDGLYIGDDLFCASCGAPGPLEPAGYSERAVLQEAKNVLRSGDEEAWTTGPLKLKKIEWRAGEFISPAAAVERCRQRLRVDPKNAGDLLRLGRLYAELGPARLATETLQRCLEIEPTCVEAALDLAQVEQRAGHPETGFAWLEQLRQVVQQWRFHQVSRVHVGSFIHSFVETYNLLAPAVGRESIRLADVEALPGGLQAIGRNDPCPCGSGKKYKRCCLQRFER